MLLTTEHTGLRAGDFVALQGELFALFDSTTQDSGNVSCGIRIGSERLFVKTAGDPRDTRPFLSHRERVALLRNAIRLRRAAADPALPVLRNVVESVEGPLLVYEWQDGELVGTSRARRSDPTSAFARFRGLETPELVAALDVIFRLHVNLARQGWIACDFYDGCLIYDFVRRQIKVIDLDNYRDAPFTNEMGRMFGSSRFMAPEEYELRAQIDQRTTVFTMGRTIQELFPSMPVDVAGVASRACEPNPLERFQTVDEFFDAWSVVLQKVPIGMRS